MPDSQLWVGKPEPQEEWFNCSGRPNMEAPGKQWEAGEGLSIQYKFYTKPVSNPMTMRRWRNSSTGLGKETTEKMKLESMDRLAAMGYTVE